MPPSSAFFAVDTTPAEVTESVILKDGTYDVFSTGVHADGFGPSAKAVLSTLLTAFGTLPLVGSAAFTLRARRE